MFKGEFSQILYNSNPNELHLIDIFEGVTHSGDKDGNNIIILNLHESYCELLDKYPSEIVTIHKGYSDNVLNSFPDNYFDLIYIDADHSYESVKKDLDISYYKVKSGGIISGHDYLFNRHTDVVLAVNEFCRKYNLTINTITLDKHPSYFIKK